MSKTNSAFEIFLITAGIILTLFSASFIGLTIGKTVGIPLRNEVYGLYVIQPDDTLPVNSPGGNYLGTPRHTFGIRDDVPLSDYEQMAQSEDDSFPPFASTVCITTLDGFSSYLGSGVLIDPEWILTAAHVVAGKYDGKPLPENHVHIRVDSNDKNGFIEAEKIFVNCQYTCAPEEARSSGSDIALIHLKEPITSIPVATYYTGTNETVGAGVWTSGFGSYTESGAQTYEGYSRLHASENILDRVVTFEHAGGMLGVDFDSPDGKVNALADNFSSDMEDLLGEGTSDDIPLALEAATVPGDSGGPLFEYLDNSWQVVGLTSEGVPFSVKPFRPISDYGDITFFTRVSSESSWIDYVLTLR